MTFGTDKRVAATGEIVGMKLLLSAISGHKTLRLLQLYVQLHASELAAKLGWLALPNFVHPAVDSCRMNGPCGLN